MTSAFDIAGSAMRAQTVRLNTIASNLANADTLASSPEAAYRAKKPVFAAVLEDGLGGVAARGIVESPRKPVARHAPDHPLADDEGYVWSSNVDPIEEMTDMISASQSYRSNVELLGTLRELAMRTLRLGE